MSSILKALRKVEEEGREAPAPALAGDFLAEDTAAPAREQEPRRLGRDFRPLVAAASVFALVIGAVALWWFLRTSEPASPPTPVAAAAAPQPTMPLPQPARVSPPPRPLPAPLPAAPPQPTPATSTPPPAQQLAARAPAPLSPPESLPAPAPAPVPQLAPTPAAAQAPVAASLPKPAPTPKPTARAAVPKPSPKPAPKRVASLPPPPTVYVDRTVWHPLAARRTAKVRIGGAEAAELKEGDAFGDLTLTRIEPSAVLFDYRGEQIRVRVGSR